MFHLDPINRLVVEFRSNDEACFSPSIHNKIISNHHHHHGEWQPKPQLANTLAGLWLKLGKPLNILQYRGHTTVKVFLHKDDPYKIPKDFFLAYLGFKPIQWYNACGQN